MLALSELGLRLKNAREEKNITLDQLQEITKIQKRYLQSIEEGKFEVLPGQFYTRAFVKSYAEAVGIDPEMLFEEHADELPVSNRQNNEIPPRTQSRKIQTTKKTQKFLALIPSVVAVVIIISLLVGIWIFFQKDGAIDEGVPSNNQAEAPVEGGRDEEALNEQPTEDVQEEEEAEIEEEIEEVPEQELEIIETKGNETIYNLLNATQFTFTIELQGKSYIGIDNRKGQTFYAQNADSGKTLEFDFSEEETIQFNFGASNNVNLFINDEPFEFPQDIVHQKVTFHFIKEEGM